MKNKHNINIDQILLANIAKYSGIYKNELIIDEEFNNEEFTPVLYIDGKIIDLIHIEEAYGLPMTDDGYVDNGIFTETLYFSELFSFEPADKYTIEYFINLANKAYEEYLKKVEIEKDEKIIKIRKPY